jgi:NAD(P)-dependent dehydrogenase (short-subunit alcohol dehydrogenase family)
MMPLLHGKRIAVLGSAHGLGLAVARLADAAGAEVHGIDQTRSFDGLSAFYRADLTNPDSALAVAHALPDGLDGIVVLPAMGSADPQAVLTHGLLAARDLVQAVAPKLAQGGAIVLRAVPVTEHWAALLPETRAAMALRHDGCAGFVKRWGLGLEPSRAVQTVGWALRGWTMAQAQAYAAQGIRLNAIAPAHPDGHLTTAGIAGSVDGPTLAAQAVLYLLSDLSAGLTGAVLATDGGLSAQMLCRMDGL